MGHYKVPRSTQERNSERHLLPALDNSESKRTWDNYCNSTTQHTQLRLGKDDNPSWVRTGSLLLSSFQVLPMRLFHVLASAFEILATVSQLQTENGELHCAMKQLGIQLAREICDICYPEPPTHLSKCLFQHLN